MKFPNWWLSTKEILLLWSISSSWRSHALLENVGQSQSYIKKMCCPLRWKLALELKETSRQKLNWENRKISRELISGQNLDIKQKWLWIGRGSPRDYEYGFKNLERKVITCTWCLQYLICSDYGQIKSRAWPHLNFCGNGKSHPLQWASTQRKGNKAKSAVLISQRMPRNLSSDV